MPVSNKMLQCTSRFRSGKIGCLDFDCAKVSDFAPNDFSEDEIYFPDLLQATLLLWVWDLQNPDFGKDGEAGRLTKSNSCCIAKDATIIQEPDRAKRCCFLPVRHRANANRISYARLVARAIPETAPSCIPVFPCSFRLIFNPVTKNLRNVHAAIRSICAIASVIPSAIDLAIIGGTALPICTNCSVMLP